MKKVLLVVALLLLATPVFAATTVSLVTEGAPFLGPDGNYVQTIRVAYTGDVNIAAFALDINMNPTANIALWRVRDYNVGESNAQAGTSGKLGYGIFPSRFRDFITPLNGKDVNSAGGYGWADTNYSPLTAWNEPGAQNTGVGFKTMVVELGTLYAGDANRPSRSGTLFRFDVNNQDHNGVTVNVAVAADALRGGVVNQDGTGATPLTFTGTTFVFPPIGGNATVPNLFGMDRVAARAAIVAANLTVGVEANVAPTAAGQAVRSINGQKPAALSVVAPGSIVDINAVTHPIKIMTAANSLYVNWIARGRPLCWAYPRQCKGDVDGKKQLTNWVSNNDLAILRTAIAKLDSQLPVGGNCADLDHKKQLTNWISNNDLAIMRLYIAKLETQIPICGSVPTASAGFALT